MPMTTPLFQEIAESIRQAIAYGKLEPGDELPPVREMAVQWDCAPGTIQRAYRELAQQGCVTSRPGQGTRVVEFIPSRRRNSLRRASLANEAEAFLLQSLSDGYSIGEVEQAIWLALDRWRAASQEVRKTSEGVIRFVGSHDPSISIIAKQFKNMESDYRLDITFSGSLGGLIALAEGKADIASCHLWDKKTNTYNAAFVRRLLPGQRIALLTLAHRRLGLIFDKENSDKIETLADIAQDHIRFINRQSGAGTRVWLDAQLSRAEINPQQVMGYDEQVMTHDDVSRAIAEKRADVGLGIETAALAYGLEFLFLTSERYDLVIPEKIWESASIQHLAQWLKSDEAQNILSDLQGYDIRETGKVTWVE
jgi:molybdate-binding protein/DNA-binding transcriptional regulator YhcF (GntR family)